MGFVDTARDVLGVVETRTNKVLGQTLEGLDEAQEFANVVVAKTSEVFDTLHNLLDNGAVVGVGFGPGSITREGAEAKISEFVKNFLDASAEADTDSVWTEADERIELLNNLTADSPNPEWAKSFLQGLTTEQLRGLWVDKQRDDNQRDVW